jgi:hypothetical protein
MRPAQHAPPAFSIRRREWPNPIPACPLVAFFAFQQVAEHGGAAFWVDYPRAIHPGRVMLDVLKMAALKLCHPMPNIVLMVTSNPLLHSAPKHFLS